jgi:neurofibromin 1
MISILKQTEENELRLLSASLLSHESSYEDTDRSNPVSLEGELYPQESTPEPQSNHHILKTKNSLLSFGSGNVSQTSSGIPFGAINASFEKTSPRSVKSLRSLEALVAKFAGRALYYISASNWPVVFGRLRSKIHFLSEANKHTDFDEVDTDDLILMKHSAMDKKRLVQILHGECKFEASTDI